jgi:hypothetical protein
VTQRRGQRTAHPLASTHPTSQRQRQWAHQHCSGHFQRKQNRLAETQCAGGGHSGEQATATHLLVRLGHFWEWKSVGLVRWCSCENRCGHWWVTVPLLSLLSLSREQPPCEHYMSFVETILRCPRGVAVSSVPETAARVGQSRPSAAEFFCVHASRAVLKAAWSGIWDACVVTTHAPHPTRPRRLLHSKHTSHNCPTSLCLIVQSEIERLVPSIRRASALKG